MKTVYANILYPIYGVTVEVADDATDEQITEALFDKGDYHLQGTQIRPIITECNIPELND